MRICYIIILSIMFIAGAFAAAPSNWPPTWVSDTNGGAAGVNQDDHTGLDYGTDQWGYWANLDIESAPGTTIATLEMRYIEPVNFVMGSFAGEEGARSFEMPRINVPSSEINGGQGFWVPALECTQLVWEEVHKLNGTAGFSELKLKHWRNTDINDIDTVAFPVDPTGYADPVDPSDMLVKLDTAADWMTTVQGNFRAAFDIYKDIRAVESQTFANVKDFCENILQAQIQGQPGGAAVTIRLPTEKEWEFICRGGTDSAYWTGPVLPGVDFTMDNLTVAKSDFLFPFDSAHIDANIHDALAGDGNLHREWFSEGSPHVRLATVTLDGVGSADHAVRKDIAGNLSISGDLVAIPVVANFDERYQAHYVANKYGSYTPILMTYSFDGTNYTPEPYASPGAGIYYKVLGRDSYVLSTTINAGNTTINKKYRTKNNILEPAVGEPGDWYLDEQLEYVEMVLARARIDGSGVDDPNGNYVFDSMGNIHPVRSLYTPAYYRNDGKYIGSTFPDMERGSQSNEEFARKADLSDNPGEEMNVEDYIAIFKQACETHLHHKKVPANPWYSGPKNYTVTYTETEFDVNGNPVEVSKSTTVTVTEIVPSTYHAEFIENITINATLNSAISAITPDDQERNPFGLYNMHGNVAEWVETTWDGMSDHSAHQPGALQITRGGSWKTGARECRSAARVGRDPSLAYDDVGFRFILND